MGADQLLQLFPAELHVVLENRIPTEERALAESIPGCKTSTSFTSNESSWLIRSKHGSHSFSVSLERASSRRSHYRSISMPSSVLER